MIMFGKSVVEKKQREELVDQVEALFKEKTALKTQLEELKLKKRLEQEEIKHMVQIQKEKNKQEVDSEKIKIEKKYQEDISKFKEEQRVTLVASLTKFHEKIEKRFDGELGNLKEVYVALMSKLPNVNFELTKKLK